MSRLGVLVVGAGDMGARHARHWNAVGARVLGVFDPDHARAEAVAAGVSAEAVDDSASFLMRADVHAVSVCTPTFLHARYTVEALEAGKDVLCEKPAALTMSDALAMRDAAARSGRKLRFGFMRRFDPASHQIMAFRGDIGDPVLAQATIAAGIRPKLLMHDAAANGGPIIDMCCHVFDQWVALFGEPPARVRAHGYTFSQDKAELSGILHKALDSAHITLRYPSGGVGQIHVSWGLPSGVEPFERHTYMGPDGLITVDWPRKVTRRDSAGTTRWKSAGLDPWLAEIGQYHRELQDDELQDGELQDSELQDSELQDSELQDGELQDGERGRLATIGDGIEALRTSLAVLESVAQDREIAPDEISGELPALELEARS